MGRDWVETDGPGAKLSEKEKSREDMGRNE